MPLHRCSDRSARWRPESFVLEIGGVDAVGGPYVVLVLMPKFLKLGQL